LSSAAELVAAGDPEAALVQLQNEVRAKAADPKLRVFLFQLLCVLGQWPRALNQLKVCGELDAGTLPMVNTYREAIQCEAVRESVFAGRTLPHVFGHPQPWVALLAQALQVEAAGDASGAARLRQQALDEAPATPGHLNGGEPFEWIADADSRLGPVLEAVINGRYCWVPFAALAQVEFEEPEDLRDLVWLPATLTLTNGGETVALVPARYPGSGSEADAAIRMGRKTEWVPLADGQYRGLGQRLLVTSQAEVALLDARELVMAPTDLPPEDDSAGTEPPQA
jgi:type VI secretion system protein ImpE